MSMGGTGVRGAHLERRTISCESWGSWSFCPPWRDVRGLISQNRGSELWPTLGFFTRPSGRNWAGTGEGHLHIDSLLPHLLSLAEQS